jgi:hypothetical protein
MYHVENNKEIHNIYVGNIDYNTSTTSGAAITLKVK